jgi:hypothetical protein
MTENNEKVLSFAPTGWHTALCFPYVVVFGWGLIIGIIISPIIQGVHQGIKLSDEFWGFKKSPL